MPPDLDQLMIAVQLSAAQQRGASEEELRQIGEGRGVYGRIGSCAHPQVAGMPSAWDIGAEAQIAYSE